MSFLWLSLWAFLLPLVALAQSDEDRFYEALLPSVRKVERPLTLFHWEPRDTAFTAKFKPDEKPEGLVAMMRVAAQSYFEKNGEKSFYLAADPAGSRNFGREDWRLIQLEIPEDWKYLDLSREAKTLEAVKKAFPEGHPCLAAIFITNNSRQLRAKEPEAFADKNCGALKAKLFQRLGVSGMRYSWLTPSHLNSTCRGTSSAAFVLTNGSWITKSNSKAYTKASKGKDPDRRAIQDLVRTLVPPKMMEREAEALWDDLPKEGPISAETKAWMNEKLLNCQGKVVEEVPETEDDLEDAPGIKWATPPETTIEPASDSSADLTP